jgi:hypothetical protein
MDTFFVLDIQRAAIQVAESLYIIATSKNIETIKSRYGFLLMIPAGADASVLDTLKRGQCSPQYPRCIQMAIDQYKTLRPNAVLQDYQLAVLSDPNLFNLNEFYCTSLLNAIKRVCEKESEEITALGKGGAKAKHISRVVDTIKSAQNELETKCSSTSSYTPVLTELRRLSAIFGTGL